MPGRQLVASHRWLVEQYQKRGLSARQVAREAGVSHTTVLAAVRKLDVNGSGHNGHCRVKGQVPFGYDLVDGCLVRNTQEQAAIRVMRQLRASGATLREVTEELNRRLVPTKNNGLWQANTVRTILAREAGAR